MSPYLWGKSCLVCRVMDKGTAKSWPHSAAAGLSSAKGSSLRAQALTYCQHSSATEDT